MPSADMHAGLLSHRMGGPAAIDGSSLIAGAPKGYSWDYWEGGGFAKPGSPIEVVCMLGISWRFYNDGEGESAGVTRFSGEVLLGGSTGPVGAYAGVGVSKYDSDHALSCSSTEHYVAALRIHSTRDDEWGLCILYEVMAHGEQAMSVLLMLKDR